MKALITGGKGFVGPYLKRELENNGYSVVVSDLKDSDYDCDITNKEKVFSMISSIKPDYVFHLAGFSSVSKSFENPSLCFKINIDGTKNLLEACLDVKKVLIVSSAEVYGKPEYVPIDEKHPLNPVSPYGKSRVEQEKIALNFSNVVISRSFNHTGEGQPSTFVIPSFKNQINEAKNGDTIYVGNLEVIRDFSDVKDVVHAYRILLEKGVLGEIYNVGSGVGVKLKDILNKLILESGKDLKVEVDSNKYRKADIVELVANVSKINELGIKIHSFNLSSY
ncbi:MAG: GDP-mannose 4,6-dehydratase [Candidatus Woesearchaeota archaeon]